MAFGGASSFSPGQPWRTPFVGRIPELATLIRHLETAEHGHGSIVLLTGEAGIGKTRTAEELCLTAERHGAAVHWGQCFEGEGAPAFWPWVQILRTWIRSTDADTVRAILGSEAVEVAQILPDIRERLPELPEPTPLHPAQARFRLFDSIATVLRRIASRPLVLVLDDLHWADEPSLLLLEFVAAHLTDVPLLIVGMYRDGELPAGNPLSTTLGGLIRRPHVQRVVLDRLSATEVAEFVADTPAMRQAGQLAQTVLDRAEGNPLFVSEMLRLLDTERIDGALQADIDRIVPPTIHEVIGRRLSRLSDSCRQVLTVAAIIGREFDLLTLRAVFPGQDDWTIDALEEAESVRIIGSVAGSAPAMRFRFTHTLVRDALYVALPASRRVRLHLQVGTAMEQTQELLTEARLSELAHHFVQAASISPPAKVLRHIQRAAQQAVKQLAYEEGARLYQLALHLAGRNTDENGEVRCDLLLRLGTVQSWMTDEAAARESFLAAAALARELGLSLDKEHAAHLLAQAALGYGGAPRLEHRRLDALGVDLLKEALTAVGEAPRADRARLLARLGTARSWAEAAEENAASLREAIIVARQVGDAQALADALVSRYYSMTIAEDLDEVTVLCDEVEALAERLRDPILALDSQRWRAKYLLSIGDLAGADAVLDTYGRRMREIRHPHAEWRIAVARMSRALMVGELAAAEVASAEAARLGPRQPRLGTPWFVGGEEHLLLAEQGKYAEALALLTDLRRDYPRAHGVRSARAWVLSQCGELEQARAELAALSTSDFTELRYGGDWNYSITFLSQLAANLRDQRCALLLYELLLPKAQQHIISGVTFTHYGAAAVHLALLAATLGRPDAARAHFEEAIRQHERMRAGPWLARSRYFFAQALLDGTAAGRPAEAIEHARLAQGAAASLGLPALEQEAGALIAANTAQQPARAGATEQRYPDGLTAREVEVLALVAGGASNAEVARALFLSPGTVHWHTVRIYQKIGASGRAEAAAYAVRHGLVNKPA